MSRYNLRPYTSVYKDPGSVEINTLQRQKFQQAFNADDALAGAVDQMKAADFEGDQNLKMELEKNTRQQLQDRSSRGDYETMMLDVSKSAREFSNEYQPIKQNAERYDAYKKRLQESYEKGDIFADTYNKSLAKSNFGYSGLQRNEDGSIDDGSYFNGYNFVKDVDIQDEMSTAMDDYAAKKGGTITQRVGQGPNAMYTIKIGENYDTVLQKDVEFIFNNVISQPDVAASLKQRVDLSTFDVTDEEIRQRLTASLYGDENDPENNGLIGQRDKAIQDGNNDLAAKLDEKIKKETSLLNSAGIESEEEAMQARQKYLRDETFSGITNRELGVAIKKFAYENVEREYIMNYDELYLTQLKSALDKQTPTVSFDTGVTQLTNPGGTSVDGINNYVETYEGAKILVSNDATTYARDKGLISGDRIITEQDILNGNVPDEMLGMLESYRRKINDANDQIYLQNMRLQEAYETTGYSQGIDNVLDKDYNGLSGSEFIDNARKVLNMPGASDENVAAEIIRLNSINDKIDIGKEPKERLTPEMLEIQDKIFKLGENRVNNFSSDFSPSLDEVNEHLEKNSRTLVGGTTSTTFPSETDPMVQPNTKAVKQTFEQRPLNPNFRIFYGGLKQDADGNVASLVKDYELDPDKPIKVTQVTFDMQPYLGEPTVSMQLDAVDPKSGNNIIVKVPTSNFQASGLDQYFNDPMYQMAMTYGKASVAGLDNVNIGFYTQNGQYNGHFQYNFGKGGNVVSIGSYNQEGKLLNTYSLNDPTIEKIIRDNTRLDRITKQPLVTFRMMTN